MKSPSIGLRAAACNFSSVSCNNQDTCSSFLFSRSIFFHLALIVYTISAVSKISYIGHDIVDLQSLAFFVPGLLLMQELVSGDWSPTSLCIVSVSGVIVIAQFAVGGNNLLAVALLLYCSRTVPFREILKVLLYLLSILLALVVIMAKTGVITDSITYREGGSVVRYGLGFVGRTYASYFILAICASIILLKRDKVKLPIMVVILLVNIWIYTQTNTRNGFILVLVIVTATVLMKLPFAIKCSTSHIKNLYGWSFIIMLLLMVILVHAFDFSNALLAPIDKVLSYRLSYTNAALSQYGVSLFGKDIDWSLLNYIVDCSYYRVAIEYGVVALSALILVMVAAGRDARIRNDKWLGMICLVYAAHLALDPTLTSVYLNPLAFYGVNALFSSATKRSISKRTEKESASTNEVL